MRYQTTSSANRSSSWSNAANATSSPFPEMPRPQTDAEDGLRVPIPVRCCVEPGVDDCRGHRLLRVRSPPPRHPAERGRGPCAHSTCPFEALVADRQAPSRVQPDMPPGFRCEPSTADRSGGTIGCGSVPSEPAPHQREPGKHRREESLVDVGDSGCRRDSRKVGKRVDGRRERVGHAPEGEEERVRAKLIDRQRLVVSEAAAAPGEMGIDIGQAATAAASQPAGESARHCLSGATEAHLRSRGVGVRDRDVVVVNERCVLVAHGASLPSIGDGRREAGLAGALVRHRPASGTLCDGARASLVEVPHGVRAG